MTAMWAAREHHRFEAAGRPFVYLVPSAAIFELDEASDSVLRTLVERSKHRVARFVELEDRRAGDQIHERSARRLETMMFARRPHCRHCLVSSVNQFM